MAAGCALVAPVSAGQSTVAHRDFLEQHTRTNGFRLGRPTRHAVAHDGRFVLFLRSDARSFVHDLYEFDCRTGEERVLLTADAILRGADENLSPRELARRERARVSERGIASFQLSRDGSRILVPLSDRLFIVERESGAVRELFGAEGFPLDPRFSPDGRSVSCVREGDLYVIDVESGRERRLTHSASDVVTNGLAEFVAQEEMLRRQGHWWSPDGAVIACQQTDVTGVEVMHIQDPAHPHHPAQAWPYPRPGRKNAAVTLALVRVAGGDPVWVEWDRNTYPYLVSAVWQRNAPLTLVVHNRTQTEALVLAVDAQTGRTKRLHREHDAAWVQFEQSVPKWLDDGSAFLWSTERNGGWQLELRARGGRLIRALNPPRLRYKKLLAIDGASGVAWIQAWTDPTERHLFRLPLGGGAPEQITRIPGEHDAEFSLDGSTYVQIESLRDSFPRQTVRRASGERVGDLKQMSETPRLLPNVECVELGGSRDYRAAIVRPHDFEAGARYPVLVKCYGGPYHQEVRAERERYYLDQWFAENGFVVVRIDGRGTPGRGRAWERVIKGNLIEVPLEDQVEALSLLGARYRELDLGRVAIYGGSFGGYFTAMAMMRNPETFHAGVAISPVTDWMDYDTYYTERYLGLPDENPEGYRDSNVLTHVSALKGPLLIVHGTADDNVYFVNSVKLVDALFHAGKSFEFVPMTNLTHRLSDVEARQRLYERMLRFMRSNLERAEAARP